MLEGLDARTIALLAVGVTLLSALVAATASLTVAFVNHWAAHRLARFNAARESRAKQLQRLEALADTRTGQWVNALNALRRQEISKYNALFDLLSNESLVMTNLNFIPLTAEDNRLDNAVKRFFVADFACRELALQCEQGERSPQDALGYIGVHMAAAVLLRAEISRFIVEGPTSRFAQFNERFGDRIERKCAEYGFQPKLTGRIPPLMVLHLLGPSWESVDRAVKTSIEIAYRPGTSSFFRIDWPTEESAL